MVSLTAAQPHNPKTVIDNNPTVDAVTALGGGIDVAGVVVARYVEHRALGHGHKKAQIAGIQITAGDDQVKVTQSAGNIEIPEGRALLIGNC